MAWNSSRNWPFRGKLARHLGRLQQHLDAVGEQEHLDRLLQLYAVERAKLEARKKGYTVSEHSLQDGSIKLNIIEGH